MRSGRSEPSINSEAHKMGGVRSRGGRTERQRVTLAGGWCGEANASAGVDAARVRELLERVAAGASLPSSVALKHSESVRVIRTEIDLGAGEVGIVLKWARESGLRGGVSARVRGTRGRRNFHRALRLMDCGIGTASPIAWIARRNESWFVAEFLERVADLDRVALVELPALSLRDQLCVKRAIIPAVAGFLHAFYASPFHHRDLKASNVLVDWPVPADGAVRAFVVDLDGLSVRLAGSEVCGVKRLVRLVASLLDHASLGSADLARFLRARPASGGEWREAFPIVLAAARDYHAAAAKRKRGKLDEFD